MLGKQFKLCNTKIYITIKLDLSVFKIANNKLSYKFLNMAYKPFIIWLLLTYFKLICLSSLCYILATQISILFYTESSSFLTHNFYVFNSLFLKFFYNSFHIGYILFPSYQAKQLPLR